MLQMSLTEIKEKIVETGNITEAELDDKIKKKLDQLSGLISKEGAAHIIANEMGVKLFESTSGKLKINNILAGMRNVETVGKVVAVYEKREFQKADGTGKVGSFIIGDETGTIRIVCWGGQADILDELEKDVIVRVISGYTRENNGRKEIHLNDRSKIITNPEGVSIGDVKTSIDYKRKKISDLEAEDRNIELMGTVVQLENLRFYEVCPTCQKRARPRDNVFVCDIHDEVKPDYSYVCNVNLDDGTGNIRVVMFRDIVEKMLDKTNKELIAIKDEPEKIENIKNNVLGEIIKVQGRVNKNEMFDRIEFVASSIDNEPDPKEEIKKVDEEIKKVSTIDGREDSSVGEEIKSIDEL